MQIMLLGTGSADGWPNPFCECSSCTTERVAGRIRRPSSALIDDVILIDCGPTAPHAAGAAGRSLRAVQHVLITHGHPDHLDPAFLLARQWTDTTSSLAVWGPPGAIDLCRDWIAPGAPVVLNVLAPGARVTLATDRGDYDLLALPAAHSSGDGDALAEEALLYQLTAANGHRLLYATDTGPLPAGTVQLMDRPVDVLILDQTFGDHHDHGTGHLDLGTFVDMHEMLADAGVTTSATQVLATHLSHHNPPTPQLRARLRVHGVIVPGDLDVIESRAASERNPLRLLILGGARSGKSTHAENAAKLFGQPITYVATAARGVDDAEWDSRIAVHRARRPADWTTVETLDIAGVLAAAPVGDVVLVDCITLWLTGVLDGLDAWDRIDAGGDDAVREDVMHRVDELVEALRSTAADVILVSNEVGWGVVPATASGRAFRDLMGIVNSVLATACTQTTLVVAGRAIALEESGTR